MAVILTGCVETPKQPVMRPIPPPPPGPPPGAAVVIYAPPPNLGVAPAQALTANSAAPPPGNYEVSSNFLAAVQATNSIGAPVQVSGQGIPQYEMIPPRPGANYVWRDGYWRWEGASWAWVPGVWEHRPPEVIFVEPGFGFGYHYNYYGGPWRHGRGRHRW